MQRNRLNRTTASRRISRDHPAHHPHSDWFRGIASLPRMRSNNELFISRTTTQRALSDDCTFDRVYTLRPVIERKKANDNWPICNAIRCNPFAKKRGGCTVLYNFVYCPHLCKAICRLKLQFNVASSSIQLLAAPSEHWFVAQHATCFECCATF